MNWKQYTFTPLRIAVLSLLGLAQFMLVMFGCVFVAKEFAEAWPWCSYLKRLAPVVGLLSLAYPAYIVAELQKPTLPDKEPKSKSSNKTNGE